MKSLVLLVTTVAALTVPSLAHAAAPPIARPDPVTYPVKLDYSTPLAATAPLDQESIEASTVDIQYLQYKKVGDLGGFVPAPIGGLSLSGGGHDVLPTVHHKSQMLLFAVAGGGRISSFTFTGNPTGPTPSPDNGNGPGITPPVAPTPGNTVPPANQGFGGGGAGGGASGAKPRHRHGGSTTTHRPPPTAPTTTTTTGPTTTTTATDTTTETTTASSIGGSGSSSSGSGGSGGGGGIPGGCSGGSCAAGTCGVAGIQVDSTAPSCTLSLSGAGPGDSVQETMTITNTTGAPYQLSFEAAGPDDNHLWQDLEMDVYDPSTPPTPPLPSLESWLSGYHLLTSLNPGQTVQYVIELYLPTTAGNADMGKSAVVAFNWQAQG